MDDEIVDIIDRSIRHDEHPRVLEEAANQIRQHFVEQACAVGDELIALQNPGEDFYPQPMKEGMLFGIEAYQRAIRDKFKEGE